MLIKRYVDVNSSSDLNEGKRGRDKTESENIEAQSKKGSMDGEQDWALSNIGKTSAGKDEIS